MIYKVGDMVEYIYERNRLFEGRIVKVRGIFKKRYIIAGEYKYWNNNTVQYARGVVEIPHSNIIKKLEE
ncbi:hypothetical protein [Terrisporobacter sp.]|uniref:hypothetical protein n=1 Tax=Terrisporobacter sp. TaxID=1965305 RepID=UPI00289A751B|nr:hypothetical protein [Terrisporobacter sp.]